MAGSASYTTTVHRSRGIVRLQCDITTDAAGDMTATELGVAFGRIVGVEYDGGLDASAVITITDVKTGATVLAYTTGTEGTPVRFRPTDIATTNAGANITAADTAPNVNRDIYVGGKLNIGVASGGNVETGSFALLVDESGKGKLGELALTV